MLNREPSGRLNFGRKPVAVVVAVATLLSGAGAYAVTSGSKDGQADGVEFVTETAGPSTTTTSAPETTIKPATTARPKVLVATTGKKLVRIDTMTGKTTKVLLDIRNELETCSRISDVHVDEARGTVYFTREGMLDGRCQSRFMKGSVDGGSFDVAVDVDGWVLRSGISPDGRSAALHVNRPNGVNDEGLELAIPQLLLVDLDHRDASPLTLDADAAFMADFFFSADNSTLFAAEQPCQCGDEVAPPGQFTSYEIRTGKATTIDKAGMDGASRVPSYRVPEEAVTTFADRTGNHVGYVTTEGKLMVIDNGGPAVKLAAGITSADW